MIPEAIGLLVIIIFLLYKWVSRNANYFEGKNVKYDAFRPFVGSYKDIVMGRKSMRDTVIKLYKQFDGEKYV